MSNKLGKKLEKITTSVQCICDAVERLNRDLDMYSPKGTGENLNSRRSSFESNGLPSASENDKGYNYLRSKTPNARPPSQYGGPSPSRGPRTPGANTVLGSPLPPPPRQRPPATPTPGSWETGSHSESQDEEVYDQNARVANRPPQTRSANDPTNEPEIYVCDEQDNTKPILSYYPRGSSGEDTYKPSSVLRWGNVGIASRYAAMVSPRRNMPRKTPTSTTVEHNEWQKGGDSDFRVAIRQLLGRAPMITKSERPASPRVPAQPSDIRTLDPSLEIQPEDAPISTQKYGLSPSLRRHQEIPSRDKYRPPSHTRNENAPSTTKLQILNYASNRPARPQVPAQSSRTQTQNPSLAFQPADAPVSTQKYRLSPSLRRHQEIPSGDKYRSPPHTRNENTPSTTKLQILNYASNAPAPTRLKNVHGRDRERSLPPAATRAPGDQLRTRPRSGKNDFRPKIEQLKQDIERLRIKFNRVFDDIEQMV